MSKKFAFFDLDHTLIPVDSCGLWAYYLISLCGDQASEFEKRQKQFDKDYFEGVLNMTDFMNFEMGLLHRFPRKELEALRRKYMEKFILPSVTPEALALIKKYRDQGYECVMVTATHRFAVEPIAKVFGMDDLIASEPETDENGEFTGGWISHSFGPRKAEAVKEFFLGKGLDPEDMEDCVFYSDSINDLPLLNLIESKGGTPFAANPDPYLEPIAQKKGWPVIKLFDSVSKPTPINREEECDSKSR